MTVRLHDSTEIVILVFFIKKACEDHDSAEFVELRRFLMDCFVEVDKDFDGMVGRGEKDHKFVGMCDRVEGSGG